MHTYTLVLYRPPLSDMPPSPSPLRSTALLRPVSEGVAFFLMSAGVGASVAKRAILYSFLLGLFSCGMGFAAYAPTENAGHHDTAWTNFYITRVVWCLGLTAFYGVMWLAPFSVVPRRPAMFRYARANVVLLVGYLCITGFLIDHGMADPSTHPSLTFSITPPIPF